MCINQIRETEADSRQQSTKLIKNLGISDKVKSIGKVSSLPLHLGFSPKNKDAKEMSKKVSDWLSKAKTNGKLKEIFRKYGTECKECS